MNGQGRRRHIFLCGSPFKHEVLMRMKGLPAPASHVARAPAGFHHILI